MKDSFAVASGLATQDLVSHQDHQDFHDPVKERANQPDAADKQPRYRHEDEGRDG